MCVCVRGSAARFGDPTERPSRGAHSLFAIVQDGGLAALT